MNVMKELCGRTPFRAEEIRLVSAQYFPDIIAEKYYGVEVKSTKENHWTSTGSSIVESTRDKNVEISICSSANWEVRRRSLSAVLMRIVSPI